VFDGEPLSPVHAKTIIRTCLGAGGEVIFTAHARVELANDQMTEQDALNVLRGGVVTHDGYQGNSHRYQVNTSRFCVVVAFDSRTKTIVVTAWRRV
jgi:hypothetical protein